MLPIDYSGRLARHGVKHTALYEAIREAIADGTLASGERLPSTRRLAAEYGLSRGSVSLAYEMLVSGGYLRAGVGQGTFVAGSPGTERSVNERCENGARATAPAAPRLSSWGKRISAIYEEERLTERSGNETGDAADIRVSFVPQGIGARWFPWAEWRAVAAARWKKLGASGEDGGSDPAGSKELRRSIAERLRRERGITCEPEDVLLTSGSMQAIALVSQILLEEGTTAVVENPGYSGIRRAVKMSGARCVEGNVDECGIVPEDWEADLLFVTPTRQFPTGAVLTYDRRLSLLSWASRRGAWIVEDDFDSDFRWGGRPVEPLKALDTEERVVYIGTFSRSMRREVRIGYAVVPKQLREPMLAAKKLYDPYPVGVAEQEALADWMAEGGYDRHMKRLRRSYGRLESMLRHRLEADLPGLFRIAPSDAGLHLYAIWLRDSESYGEFKRECRLRGVAWKDGTGYDAHRGSSSTARAPAALFGFSHLEEGEIEVGISAMREAAATIREG